MRASLVSLFCACIAGCAGTGGLSSRQDDGASLLPEGLAAQAAGDAVVVGKSSKADVAAALGKATQIKFDSGYEVWVYRGREAARGSGARTEFVVLFAPSGIVKKTRIRPPDPVR
ncbi:MAG TPA: hypothetical protein VKP68_08715 [Ramlibacter sp.]|nr:hypothetical protein [Ramlibacter sp.]